MESFNDKKRNATLANLLPEEYSHIKASLTNESDQSGALHKDATDNHSKVHFLDLPRELRDCIYEYAVLRDEEYGIAVNLSVMEAIRGGYSSEVRDCAQPALTKVCRQLRYEALPLFYQLNGFVLSLQGLGDPVYNRKAILADWLGAIGPENFRHIRKLGLLRRHRRYRSAFCDGYCEVTLREYLNGHQLTLAKETRINAVIYGWDGSRAVSSTWVCQDLSSV